MLELESYWQAAKDACKEVPGLNPPDIVPDTLERAAALYSYVNEHFAKVQKSRYEIAEPEFRRITLAHNAFLLFVHMLHVRLAKLEPATEWCELLKAASKVTAVPLLSKIPSTEPEAEAAVFETFAALNVYLKSVLTADVGKILGEHPEAPRSEVLEDLAARDAEISELEEFTLRVYAWASARMKGFDQ